MLFDPRRYQRGSYTEEQRDFLSRLVSFARFIQQTTYDKCRATRIETEMGICASLVMADIVVKSDWGTHEIAKKENNLCLLPKADYWKGKCAESGGVSYRTYSSWLDFSVDLSDELTFFERKKYEELLKAGNVDLQSEILANLQPDPTSYRGRIEELIERCGLWEFDW